MKSRSRVWIDKLIADLRAHGDDGGDAEGKAYWACWRWRRDGATGTYDEIARHILAMRELAREGK